VLVQGKKFDSLMEVLNLLEGRNETGWLLWLEAGSMVANPRHAAGRPPCLAAAAFAPATRDAS
jgi:hypothetical protein